MKSLIITLGLIVCFQALASAPVEALWKSKVRNVIVSILGESWGDKILGQKPKDESVVEVVMPEIPMNLKKTTNLESYSKKVKNPTEFDRLPTDTKRQFDYKFIEELFWVTRKAQAKDEDMANWLNTLDQGGSREGLYQALVLDEVYSSLEAMDEKPSEKLKEFTLTFSQKFLNQTFKAESLVDLNLYSLKRIMVEKGLDILDFYETKDLDDLYRWYAVLSSDLARDYGNYMKSTSRKDVSAQYYYTWAKDMPIQHIKSEFIIKLHEIMNGLQAAQ